MTAIAVRCARCNRLLLRADVDLDRAEREGLTFGGYSELLGKSRPVVVALPGYIMVPPCKKHHGYRWTWPPKHRGPFMRAVAIKVKVADVRAALRRGGDLTV